MFSQVSVHGGCLVDTPLSRHPQADTPPPGQTHASPWADTPPFRADIPPGRHPTPPGQTPTPRADTAPSRRLM